MFDDLVKSTFIIIVRNTHLFEKQNHQVDSSHQNQNQIAQKFVHIDAKEKRKRKA